MKLPHGNSNDAESILDVTASANQIPNTITVPHTYIPRNETDNTHSSALYSSKPAYSFRKPAYSFRKPRNIAFLKAVCRHINRLPAHVSPTDRPRRQLQRWTYDVSQILNARIRQSQRQRQRHHNNLQSQQQSEGFNAAYSGYASNFKEIMTNPTEITGDFIAYPRSASSNACNLRVPGSGSHVLSARPPLSTSRPSSSGSYRGGRGRAGLNVHPSPGHQSAQTGMSTLSTSATRPLSTSTHSQASDMCHSDHIYNHDKNHIYNHDNNGISNSSSRGRSSNLRRISLVHIGLVAHSIAMQLSHTADASELEYGSTSRGSRGDPEHQHNTSLVNNRTTQETQRTDLGSGSDGKSYGSIYYNNDTVENEVSLQYYLSTSSVLAQYYLSTSSVLAQY